MQKALIKKVKKNELEAIGTIVGVYNSHIDAINAIIALEKEGIPISNISFLSTAAILSDNLQTRSVDNIKNAPVAIGDVLGPLLGVFSGASIWAVPGLGFVYGAGAVLGTIAGFDIGLVSGGIATLLLTRGIKKEKILTYHKHLKEGKFLVILNSNEVIAAKAKKIVHKVGNYIELVMM